MTSAQVMGWNAQATLIRELDVTVHEIPLAPSSACSLKYLICQALLHQCWCCISCCRVLVLWHKYSIVWCNLVLCSPSRHQRHPSRSGDSQDSPAPALCKESSATQRAWQWDSFPSMKSPLPWQLGSAAAPGNSSVLWNWVVPTGTCPCPWLRNEPSAMCP